MLVKDLDEAEKALASELKNVGKMRGSGEKTIFEDDFVTFCGFERELITAIFKLKNCEYLSYLTGEAEKAVIIAWVLKLYDNIKTLRIQTIRGLKKAITYTPVRLLKNDMKRIITNMERIDDSALLESFFDDLFKKVNASFYKTLNEYEGDYYDLKIQVNTVADEDDALAILHTINTKISILDNFIDNSIQICKEVNPEKGRKIKKFLKGNIHRGFCNMFIMKKEDFCLLKIIIKYLI